MENLRPCPFCGKEAYASEAWRDGYYASCGSCFCVLGECYESDGTQFGAWDTLEEAISAWNTRCSYRRG